LDIVDVRKNFSFRNPRNYINIAYFKILLIVTKKIRWKPILHPSGGTRTSAKSKENMQIAEIMHINIDNTLNDGVAIA